MPNSCVLIASRLYLSSSHISFVNKSQCLPIFITLHRKNNETFIVETDYCSLLAAESQLKVS